LSEALDEEMVQADKGMTELSERGHLSQVPSIPSPFLSESVLLSDTAKRGSGHTVPSAKASEASEALGARKSRKKQAAPLLREKLPTSLDALPGNGTGASSPSGEDTQGPSPVDYNLEIEAKFPLAMVIELQKNAALKARKTVIGKTLAGRASFKDLQDCLKLHLPAPFLMVTLLTRGYFEVLFEKEEGARAAKKLAVVEWSDWALSFSRYLTLFKPNEHGAKMLLTHSIEVQFLNLHVQLRTEKALTIMASSIRDVLDIESPDSYIKRLAGPMVTVEVKDISKLAGIIKIPSMAEGTRPGDTTAQRILYSGLPNQCKKCRKFGHLTKTCPLNRSPTQDRSIPANFVLEGRGRNVRGENTSAQRWSTGKFRRSTEQQDNGGGHTGKDDPNKGKGTGRNPQSSVNLNRMASNCLTTSGEEEKKKKLTPPLPPPLTRLSSIRRCSNASSHHHIG